MTDRLFDLDEPSGDGGGGAGPTGPTHRIGLLVAYDGGGFHGFAENRGVRTVASELRAALRTVLGHDVGLTCAGRTDRGVHAWGQVVSFDAADDRADPDRLQKSLNSMCGPEIVVRDAAVVPPDFDARFTATARRYRYTILNAPVPDPFRHGRVWHLRHRLDLDVLRLACDPLIGEHDFTSFCRKMKTPSGPSNASLVRRVTDARWEAADDGTLTFWIEANAFCHQMVRSIVGTLVQVGRGNLTAGDVHGIIAARDRRAAPDLAPPEGLCLWHVTYPVTLLGEGANS